jgi:hypothetical protein
MDSQTPKQNDELAEREADATDKETLDDLEDAFGGEENTPEDQADVPSPDGALDEDKELKQTDPL